MLYEFKTGLKATESARHINSTFGVGTMSEHPLKDWVARFRTGDHDFKDQPRSGRSSELHGEHLCQLIEHDQQQITRQLVEALGYNRLP